jgi:hypothetical protein
MNDVTQQQQQRDMVSLKEYVDTRFAAESKAVILALETVKVAMERDDRRLSTWLSILSIVVSVAVTVYMLAKHT